MTPAEVLAMARENNVRVADVRFVDLLGTWQHFSLPIEAMDEEAFAEGLGFDGSSIRGWKTIDQSDMLVIPDPTTAWLDPFLAEPTLILNCNIQDCITREDYDRDRLTWLWDVTTLADKQIIFQNQQGVNSRYYRPGPYGPMEPAARSFVAWYLEQIAQGEIG